MPRFRQNHTKRRSGSTYIIRLFVIVVFICSTILWGSRRLMEERPQKESSSQPQSYIFDRELTSEERLYFIDPKNRLFLPEHNYQLSHHNYYSLGYDEEAEISRWVCYELTKESLDKKNVKRYDWYMSDTKVRTGSAHYQDYRSSGWSRGHLAPAGDMAFNELAMQESFLMSNMTPQVRAFNGGVWNELEQNVRDWALHMGKVAVCSGPVFWDDQIKYIGFNKVAVPHAFYKAVLDVQSGASIAFIIANDVTDLPLNSFAMSVDQLEDELELDLFAGYESTIENQNEKESELNLELWAFDKERYQKRVEIWNKR